MPALKPHSLFHVWSPDQVAECIDGVPAALYARIWNDIVPLYDGAPRSEVPDDFSERCVAKYWDKFTEAERIELNALAVRHDGPDTDDSDDSEPDHLRNWYDTRDELR